MKQGDSLGAASHGVPGRGVASLHRCVDSELEAPARIPVMSRCGWDEVPLEKTNLEGSPTPSHCA